VTITVTILLSGFVSLTLTPMLCARVLKSHHEEERQNVVLRISKPSSMQGSAATR